MNKFNQIKEEIKNTIKNSKSPGDSEHSIICLKWLLKINSNATEEAQIAALAHDIDRAVDPRVLWKEGKETYAEYKQRHAARSSELIGNIMKKHGYSEESINKVKKMVKNHEVGGDEETDQLRDADSITYFELNVFSYLEERGFEKTKNKIKFMYERASNRARELIKELDLSPEVDKVFEVVLKEL
ncbi:DUF4202 family protein [archaeon]|jgi:hypothetical protein|nr:DUF4202 family protein [archaeon]MBT4416812.1 DUF4202 family protein [archaeon]